MGVVAGISIHHAVADVSLRGTDRLHHTNEYKDAIVHGKNTQRKSRQMEQLVRNLASRNAGRMILMDLEHELRALDQSRFTTDELHFDSIEGQGWMNRVFKERLDELEIF